MWSISFSWVVFFKFNIFFVFFCCYGLQVNKLSKSMKIHLVFTFLWYNLTMDSQIQKNKKVIVNNWNQVNKDTNCEKNSIQRIHIVKYNTLSINESTNERMCKVKSYDEWITIIRALPKWESRGVLHFGHSFIIRLYFT
jgi:hypothetical protein